MAKLKRKKFYVYLGIGVLLMVSILSGVIRVPLRLKPTSSHDVFISYYFFQLEFWSHPEWELEWERIIH